MVHKASFKLLAWATTAHAIVIEPFEASYVSPPWDTWCLVTVLLASSKVDMPHAGHLQLMVLITCGGGTSVSPTGPSQPGYVQTQQSVPTQTVHWTLNEHLLSPRDVKCSEALRSLAFSPVRETDSCIAVSPGQQVLRDTLVGSLWGQLQKPL